MPPPPPPTGSPRPPPPHPPPPVRTDELAISALVNERITVALPAEWWLPPGSRVRWATSAAACVDAAAASFGGEAGVSVPDDHLVTWTFDTPVKSMVLCYQRDVPTGDWAAEATVTLLVRGVEAFTDTIVADVESTVVIPAVGAEASDVAFWTSSAATSCGDADVNVARGGLVAATVVAAGAALSFTVTTSTEDDVAGWQLCYLFSASTNASFVLYPEVRLAALQVTAAAPLTVTLGSATTMTFAGYGVGAGDEVKWLEPTATTCTALAHSSVGTMTANGTALVTLRLGGMGLRLCYAFHGEEYTLHPDITLNVPSIDATALGTIRAVVDVAWAITIAGEGLTPWDELSFARPSADGSVDCAETVAGPFAAIGAGTSANATVLLTEPFEDLAACYNHSGTRQLVPYADARFIAATVLGPNATIAVVGSSKTVVLTGVGMAVGDAGYFTDAAAACDGPGASASATAEFTVTFASFGGTLAEAAFTPTVAVDGLVLCYRFSSDTAFRSFATVSLDVLEATGLAGGAAFAPVATTLVVAPVGRGIAAGDRAYWSPAGTTTCREGDARRTRGGIVAVDSAGQLAFDLAAGGGAEDLVLCYAFRTEPFAVVGNATATVAEVTGPQASVIVQEVPDAEDQTLSFSGTGVGAGDVAFFALASDGCTTANAATSIATVRTDGSASFTAPDAGTGLVLCYQFASHGGGTAVRFPRVALTVTPPDDPFALATFSSLSPTAAAVGYDTTVTVAGSDLNRASAVVCILGLGDGAVDRRAAASFSATSIVCDIPATLTATVAAGQEVTFAVAADEIDPDTNAPWEPVVLLSSFVLFNASAVTVTRLVPPGGPQGVDSSAFTLTVEGDNIRDYGDVLVTFVGRGDPVGGVVGDSAVSALTTSPPYASPLEPATAVAVAVSVNGQTFGPSGASFQFYVAAVSAGAPLGAAVGATEALTLSGTGFIDLGATQCLFYAVAADGSVASSPLEAAALSQDDSAINCAAPAGAPAGAYQVALTLNGGFALVPNLFEAVSFTLYNPRDVVVLGVSPPGGPTAGGTVVTVFGRGFADYGVGQLCCQFGGAEGCGAEGTLLAASAAGEDRLVCTAPAALAPGTVALEVSLAGGAAGSATASGVGFHYYSPPVIDAVTPAVGDASGGTVLTIVGAGFMSLAQAPVVDYRTGATPLGLLRVAFGPILASEAPTSASDTELQLTTEFGSGTVAVRVVPNGEDLGADSGAQFTFQGLHSPEVVRAVFNSEATQLLVFFDDQPTDQGGLSGRFPCSVVLSPATSVLLRGAYDEPPQCYWANATLLVAELNHLTALGPGSAVALRENTIRPALATEPCPHDYCATGGAVIDADFPCLGACPQPVASLSGPLQISRCPGEALRLDASASTGGGIKALSYDWRVDPTRSDYAEALNAELLGLGDALPDITLQSLQGSSFTFLLRVRSFLNRTSSLVEWTVARSGGASPTLAIDGPFESFVRPAAELLLQGQATVAACFFDDFDATNGTASAEILFSWSVFAADTPDDVAALSAVLASLDTTKAALLLPAFSLTAGVTYELQLRAEMAADPASFSTARVRIVTRTEPLRALVQGGDSLRLFQGEEVNLDGSASFNPNLPAEDGAAASALGRRLAGRQDRRLAAGNATDNATDTSRSSLTYAWALYNATDGEALAWPSGTTGVAGPVLRVPAGGLAAGQYTVVLTVSSAGFPAATASVNAELRAVQLPTVTIAPLPRAKYNPTWELPTDRLALEASLGDGADAVLAALGASDWNYAWTAVVVVGGEDAGTLALGSTEVTTTGAAKPNLAFLSGALVAGAHYRFELTVTAAGAVTAGAEGFAAVAVIMNRPPFGGALTVSPEAGGFAVQTPFTLEARGWTDDAEDLPLQYAFALLRGNATTEEALSDFVRAPALEAFLPAGVVHLIVAVVDAFGGEARATATIVVESPPAFSSANASDAAAVAASLASSGSAAAATQLAASVASATDFGATADGGASVVNGLLAASKAAAAASAATANARKLQTGLLSAVLGAGPAALDGDAQGEAATQLDSIVGGAQGEPVGDAVAGHVGASLSAILGADVTKAGDSGAASVNRAARRVATGLASSLLAGAVSGEKARTVVSANANVSATREVPSALEGASVGAAGGAGRARVPDGALAGQTGVDGGVDVKLFTLARNIHGDPADNANGTIQTDGSLQAVETPIFGFALAAPGGADLRVRGLPEPFIIDIPLSRGQPAHCFFWDEAVGAWSDTGCVTVGTRDDGTGGQVLGCACTHLTDFAGIGVDVPTSTEDVQEDLESIRINTFSVQEAAVILADVDFEANPYIYWTVVGMALACGVTVALCGLRDYMDMRRDWEAKAERQERVAKALEARLDAFDDFVAARAEAAATMLQKVTRGKQARDKTQPLFTELRGDRRAGREHLVTKLWRQVVSAVESDHSVLGLWFGDPGEQRRAELTQIFWSVAMLALVIECMFYSNAEPEPEQPPGSDDGLVTVQLNINVVQLVVIAAITAALCMPALLLYRFIFSWGYDRRSPLAERFFDRILLGETPLDKKLVSAASAHKLEAVKDDTARLKAGRVLPMTSAAAAERYRAPSMSPTARPPNVKGPNVKPPVRRPVPPSPPKPTRPEAPSPPAGMAPTDLPAGPPQPTPPPADAGDGLETMDIGDDDARRRRSTIGAPGYTKRPARTDSTGAAVDEEAAVAAAMSPVSVRTAGPRASVGSNMARDYTISDETVALLRARFVRYDRDDSGSIDMDELGKLMRDLGFVVSKRKLRRLRDDLDTSGNGTVGFGELVTWYDAMVQVRSSRAAGRGGAPGRPGPHDDAPALACAGCPRAPRAEAERLAQGALRHPAGPLPAKEGALRRGLAHGLGHLRLARVHCHRVRAHVRHGHDAGVAPLLGPCRVTDAHPRGARVSRRNRRRQAAHPACAALRRSPSSSR